MTFDFKENQLRYKKRIEEQKKLQRKREIKKNIAFVVCLLGIITLLCIALNNISNNAQKKCEAAGNEITFCKNVLD